MDQKMGGGTSAFESYPVVTGQYEDGEEGSMTPPDDASDISEGQAQISIVDGPDFKKQNNGLVRSSFRNKQRQEVTEKINDNSAPQSKQYNSRNQ